MSRGNSFPVGKVDFLQLNPVCFSEFLSAADPKLVDYIESIDRIEPLPDIFFHPLIDKLKINAYGLDFSKHAHNKEISKINHLWSSIPSQLARDNKKFLYQTVK